MGSVHALLIIALLWVIFMLITRKSEPASRAEELDASFEVLMGDIEKGLGAHLDIETLLKLKRERNETECPFRSEAYWP